MKRFLVFVSALPKFDGNKLRNMTVRAGKPVKIDLPYSGYPAPTFTWTKNGKPLEVNQSVVLPKIYSTNSNFSQFFPFCALKLIPNGLWIVDFLLRSLKLVAGTVMRLVRAVDYEFQKEHFISFYISDLPWVIFLYSEWITFDWRN